MTLNEGILPPPAVGATLCTPLLHIYTGRVLILQCRAERIRLFVSFLYHCAVL